MAEEQKNQTGAQGLHGVLVSPQKILWEGKLVMASVPGVEGEAGIRIGHARFLTLLKAGPLSLELEDGTKTRFVIFGGFAETDGKKIILLVEEAVPFETLDASAIAQEMAEAQEDLGLGGHAAAGAQARLARAQVKREALARFA